MKAIRISLLIIIAGVLLSGCKEKNSGIEVVPNLELIYVSQSQVDVPLKWGGQNDLKEKKDMIKIFKSIKVSNPKSPIVYRVAVRFFVNEKGTIDKIKDMGSNISCGDSTVNIDEQNQIEKIVEAFATNAAGWKFSPAIKNGKAVKSYANLNVSFTDNPDGSSDINYGDFLTVTPGINDFILVDKMPQVITPIVPHYPELAKRAGVEGTVYVKTLVNAEGMPVKAVVIKSDNEIFNQPSIDAAMNFRFSAAYKGYMSVPVWVVIPFKYKLDGSKGELMKYKDLKKMPAKK